MKALHLHHKRVAGAILSSVDPETFAPTRLTVKALNDDSCWDELDTEFDEPSIPCFLMNSIDDDF